MTDLTVANIILQQLGGNRFIAMTGAKDFAGTEKSLTFRIPRSKGIRIVKVELTPADDQLQSLFTEATGLYTKF